MKKTLIFCTLCLALLLSGCAQTQDQMTYIGAEKAKQLALEASGLTAAGVETMTTDLNTRNGTDYYQVDFTADGQSYQYDIDALTGVVIEARSPSAAASSDSQASSADAYTDASSTGPVQTPPETQPETRPETQRPGSGSAAGSGASNSAADGMISADEAKAKALSHAGLTSDQVTFVKSKLDYEDGRQIYEVEFYAGSYTEYDYEIDAYTGDVISFGQETEGAASSSGGSMITEEKAKELALAQVPGAVAGDIQKFKLDYDDGRAEYEGTIIYNGMEYEFEIDAYSGAFRSWEAEPAGR